jgi:hypothetical protein
MSPTNQLNESKQEVDESEPSTHAIVVKSSRQGAIGKRMYDSDSQRDSSFQNDLQVLPHHDKSFNEQLDDKGKFILNQDAKSNQHNLSIGAIVGQGGTVRQSVKRIHSQERGGKIQRPRSSKGYRANAGPIQLLGP